MGLRNKDLSTRFYGVSAIIYGLLPCACLVEARRAKAGAVGERNLGASPYGEAAYGSPAVQLEGRNPGAGINVIRTPPNGGVA